MNLLLVEDQERFAEAAREAFEGKKIDLTVARDYESAMSVLERPYAGAIVDCFFPRSSGTDDRTLGMHALELMLEADPEGKEIHPVMKQLAQYIDFSDTEYRQKVQQYMRHLIRLGDPSCLPDESRDTYALPPTLRELYDVPLLEHFRELLDTATNVGRSEVVRECLDMYMMPLNFSATGLADYLGIEMAIQEDPRNQSLGILVGKKLIQQRTPFIMATSTYHHDSTTEPVLGYCTKQGWKYVDANPQAQDPRKDDKRFWHSALEKLTEQMEASQ